MLLAIQDAGPAGSVSLATDKFAAALKVKQAAAAGRFDEVEAELRRLDDNFFADSHPKAQQPADFTNEPTEHIAAMPWSADMDLRSGN
jgi:hypothetical protein